MSFVPDLAQSCRENDELIADHEIIDHCAWMSSQAGSPRYKATLKRRRSPPSTLVTP
jgi:hypothetical protein